MIIHFVCTGNTYRSRLAQTYCNARQISGITAISSGITAEKNENGAVAWCAQRIIKNNNLIPFEKPIWQQTTKALLEEGDLTIFLTASHYVYCKKHFSFNKKYEVWDIADLDGFTPGMISVADDIAKIKATENTFSIIKIQVDGLLFKLQKE